MVAMEIDMDYEWVNMCIYIVVCIYIYIDINSGFIRVDHDWQWLSIDWYSWDQANNI